MSAMDASMTPMHSAPIYQFHAEIQVQPLESLTPVLREPFLPGKRPAVVEVLPKLKSLFMASYFGFDHLVWLGSVGLIKEKALLERCAQLLFGLQRVARLVLNAPVVM